jgi:nicotinamidase-related amidase
MKTLCIIDMQSGFRTARNKDTIDSVCAEVKKAKRYGWPIVLVEYTQSRFGHTMPKIRRELKGYKKTYRVTKHADDGSRQVLAAIATHQLGLKPVRVCGVNISFCVRETVLGLLEKVPACKIELVKSACNCPNGRDATATLQARNEAKIKVI